jgi:hypothetical protein
VAQRVAHPVAQRGVRRRISRQAAAAGNLGSSNPNTEIAMIRFRTRKPLPTHASRPAKLPDFWHGDVDQRRALSLAERAEAAREHGAADIVTPFGLVLSLR